MSSSYAAGQSRFVRWSPRQEEGSDCRPGRGSDSPGIEGPSERKPNLVKQPNQASSSQNEHGSVVQDHTVATQADSTQASGANS
jgi:hypothetical protein